MKAFVIDVEKRKQNGANRVEELAKSAAIDARGLNEFWMNDLLC